MLGNCLGRWQQAWILFPVLDSRFRPLRVPGLSRGTVAAFLKISSVRSGCIRVFCAFLQGCGTWTRDCRGICVHSHVPWFPGAHWPFFHIVRGTGNHVRVRTGRRFCRGPSISCLICRGCVLSGQHIAFVATEMWGVPGFWGLSGICGQSGSLAGVFGTGFLPLDSILSTVFVTVPLVYCGGFVVCCPLLPDSILSTISATVPGASAKLFPGSGFLGRCLSGWLLWAASVPHSALSGLVDFLFDGWLAGFAGLRRPFVPISVKYCWRFFGCSSSLPPLWWVGRATSSGVLVSSLVLSLDPASHLLWYWISIF